MQLNPNAARSRAQTKQMLKSSGIELKDIDIVEIDAGQLAEHMTTIDHDLLKEIAGQEFLMMSFASAQTSPGFAAMVAKFNEVISISMIVID